MRLLLASFVLLVTTTFALGQTIPIATAAGPPALSLKFSPTTGIDKSFRLSNNLVISLSQPDIVVFDGSRQTALTVGKSSRPQLKRVAARNTYLLVRHAVNGLDYFDYVVKKSDTIRFTYAQGTPLATVTTSKHLPYDYAFENYAKARFFKGKYSALTSFLNPMYFHDFSKKPLAQVTPAQRKNNRLVLALAIKQKAYPQASSSLRAEEYLLDSLREHKLISPAPYAFYKDKVKNLRYILDVETNRLTSSQVQQLLAYYQADTTAYPAFYHHKFLEAAADKYLTDEAPYLELKDGVNRDYRQVYAQLRASTLFPAHDKDYLLARELERIRQAFSQADFLSFFQQFTRDVQDTTLVAAARAQYALEFDKSRSTTNSVVLTTAGGTKLTLAELLKRHAGKVVYLDFWASWCEPCREALPSSLQLRNKLKDKQVVVVYLSIDKTMQPWLTASSQENLTSYPDNYLVVNYQSANFFKQHQLTSIPRYMILDKQGKLVHANAPSAESKQTAALLTDLTQ